MVMKTAKHHIPIFYLTTILFWFSMYTYVPTLSTYAKSLGAAYKMVGLIIGSYGFTQMLLRVPLGIISDKLNNRKLFISIGIFLSLLSSLGFCYFTNVNALLIFRSLSGAAAASWVVFTVLFSNYFEEHEAPKAIGIINSFNSIGNVTAIFIGGIASQYLGSRSPFVIAALAAGVSLFMSAFIFDKQSSRSEPIKLSELFLVAKDGNLLLVSFLGIITQFIIFATVYGFTPIVAKQLGATDFEIGLLATLSTLPGIFSSVLSGSFFAKRLGEKRTISSGLIISALCCIVIPYIHSLYLLFISQIVSGFCWGGVFPLLMGLSIKGVRSNKRATAMGLFQALYGLGMFLGPFLVGILGDVTGLASGFWIIGFVGFAGALLTQFAKDLQ
jgi:MFS family permease